MSGWCGGSARGRVFAVASTLRHHLTIHLRRRLRDQPGNATKAAPCDGHAGELLTKTQDLLCYYWFRQILTPVITLLCFCKVGHTLLASIFFKLRVNNVQKIKIASHVFLSRPTKKNNVCGLCRYWGKQFLQLREHTIQRSVRVQTMCVTFDIVQNTGQLSRKQIPARERRLSCV